MLTEQKYDFTLQHVQEELDRVASIIRAPITFDQLVTAYLGIRERVYHLESGEEHPRIAFLEEQIFWLQKERTEFTDNLKTMTIGEFAEKYL